MLLSRREFWISDKYAVSVVLSTWMDGCLQCVGLTNSCALCVLEPPAAALHHCHHLSSCASLYNGDRRRFSWRSNASAELHWSFTRAQCVSKSWPHVGRRNRKHIHIYINLHNTTNITQMSVYASLLAYVHIIIIICLKRLKPTSSKSFFICNHNCVHTTDFRRSIIVAFWWVCILSSMCIGCALVVMVCRLFIFSQKCGAKYAFGICMCFNKHLSLERWCYGMIPHDGVCIM